MVEREVNKLLSSEAANPSRSPRSATDGVVGGRVAEVELEMKPLINAMEGA